jgi:cobaltochelatase CobN
MDPGLRRDDGGVGDRTKAVLAWIAATLAPALDRSGGDEIAGVLAALDGRFVPPGPSGAPTRGRPDVLPTGRNFYSVDVRAVPTAAAWAVGRAAAEAMALRYFQDEGEWPRSVALSAWSTSNMRTGGDDVAQALALIGAMPEWEPGTGRVTGFRVLSFAELGRPRIDVTLKISGMFRDAFPGQIDLLDSAIRAIAALEEDETANPIAASVREEISRLNSASLDLAERRATARIFGNRPGTYGTGLQTLLDEDIWTDRNELAETFVEWGAHPYGGSLQGEAVPEAFRDRLRGVQAVIQPQDNREHDILDSDEYWQFVGGFASSVAHFRGISPRLYHSDTSSQGHPRIRSLQEEIGRVVRGRATNPKWIAGMMRHGYKGAAEMAATVDYLHAFAATTDAVGDPHFDAVYQAFIGNAEVLDFLRNANPAALREMGDKFRRAIERGLWSPRSNSAYDRLSALINEHAEAAE